MEKRSVTSNVKNVKMISPIFWKYCCKCKQEFRGNYGWKFNLYYGGGGDFYSKTYYVCSECANTEEEAENILKLVQKNKI